MYQIVLFIRMTRPVWFLLHENHITMFLSLHSLGSLDPRLLASCQAILSVVRKVFSIDKIQRLSILFY